MSENNGVTNYELLSRIDETKQELSSLEVILNTGFRALTDELRALQTILKDGMLKTINVLCYCLVAVIMWVTGLKTISQIFGGE